MVNFDLEVQLEDLVISRDDNSDKSTDAWKTGLELHEDKNSIFSSFDSKFNNRYVGSPDYPSRIPDMHTIHDPMISVS
jgi:hypothetical protein